MKLETGRTYQFFRLSLKSAYHKFQEYVNRFGGLCFIIADKLKRLSVIRSWAGCAARLIERDQMICTGKFVKCTISGQKWMNFVSICCLSFNRSLVEFAFRFHFPPTKDPLVITQQDRMPQRRNSYYFRLLHRQSAVIVPSRVKQSISKKKLQPRKYHKEEKRMLCWNLQN